MMPGFREGLLSEKSAYTSNSEIFQERTVEEFFEIAGAREWIEQHRVPVRGPLDNNLTAQALGIPLEYFSGKSYYSGQLEGINDSRPLRILVHEECKEPPVVFGHEVGHAYLEFIVGVKHPATRSGKIEKFCELFGTHFALPLSEIVIIEEVNEQILIDISERYQTSISATIYQFVRAGLLPPRIYVDSKIGMKPRNGEIYRDVICMPCEIEYGSCAGTTKPDRVLSFPDHEFGGHFPTCQSETGILNQQLKTRGEL